MYDALRIVSYNISGHNVSQGSSDRPQNLEEKYGLLAEELLAHAPAVIALQELPLGEGPQYPVQLLEAQLGAAGFLRVAQAEAHCGFSCLYLHTCLRAQAAQLEACSVGPAAAVLLDLPAAAVAPPEGGPVGLAEASGEPWCQQHQRQQLALAQAEEAQRMQPSGIQPIRLFGGDSEPPDPQQPPQPLLQPGTLRVCLAGVHLEPFAEGADRRLRQLQRLLDEAAAMGATHLVIVGDTNMRVAETQVVLDLGLQDAHLATGQPQLWTWDTRRNKYYGKDTREYVARYDRVFCSNNMAVRALGLVGDTPASSGGYLSDHFGLLCTLGVTA